LPAHPVESIFYDHRELRNEGLLLIHSDPTLHGNKSGGMGVFWIEPISFGGCVSERTNLLWGGGGCVSARTDLLVLKQIRLRQPGQRVTERFILPTL